MKPEGQAAGRMEPEGLAGKAREWQLMEFREQMCRAGWSMKDSIIVMEPNKEFCLCGDFSS